MPVIDRFTGAYAFLNNFHPHPIRYEDRWYRSNEHAFAAAKTLDETVRARIAAAVTPGEAKRLGRAAPLRTWWDQYLRYTVMEELQELKFVPRSELAARLLSTGDAVLIEGNEWHDQVWGDCRCGRATCLSRGMNLLGWMLMRRRTQLANILDRVA
jgi:ribA/ribD-fused uncharacterized protein